MPLERRAAAFPFLAEPGGFADRCDAEPPARQRSQEELTHPLLSDAAIELVAERFRILSDPLRVRIIQQLQKGEHSVSQLATILGASQPNVSKHLRIIQNAGITGRRQEGNLVYYSIADPSVLDLCDAVCSAMGEPA